jgi:hypothetical protein
MVFAFLFQIMKSASKLDLGTDVGVVDFI